MELFWEEVSKIVKLQPNLIPLIYNPFIYYTTIAVSVKPES